MAAQNDNGAAADVGITTLRPRAPLTERDHAELISAQRRLGLTHGDRPLCTVQSPLVLASWLADRIARDAALVMRAVERVVQQARSDRGLATRLGVTEREWRWASIGHRALPTVAIGRLDLVFTEPGRGTAAGFAFIELNADSPAGTVDQLLLAQTQLVLPGVQAALRGRVWRPEDVPAALLATLLARYTAERGTAAVARPHIAIVDWHDVGTRDEQQVLARLWTERGHRVSLLDPRALRLADGRLVGPDGGAIDLVYRRLIARELFDRLDDDHPLLRAYANGAVTVANPLTSVIANKKALFAELSAAAANDDSTQRDEARAVARTIPWTRSLADASARQVALEDPEQFVVKPNDEYGGHGVVLGWRATRDEWQRAVDEGAASGGIVQRRVAARRLPFALALPGDAGIFEEMTFDCCPFMLDGTLRGLMARVSSSEVSNVSAGGGVTSALVVEASGDEEQPLHV